MPDHSPKTWRTGTLTYTLGGIVVLFLLLLIGDFIWSLRERSTSMIALVLFKKFGASDFLNGLIISALPCAIGLILCPIISYRSDRRRGRFGRRIPYLFITTPIVFTGMAGMAFSPWLGQFIHIGLSYQHTVLVLFGIFWTLFEFGALAGNVVFTALINDVVPRELLGRFFGMFRIMSLLAGIIFNYWLLGYAETHYMWLFLGLGIIYAGGFTLMCFKVKEGSYPAPPELPPEERGAFAATRTYFRECFNSPYYILIFTMLMIAGLTFIPVNTYCVFYAQKLDIPLDNYGKYTAYSFVISFLLSYPLGMLADKFHPLRCGITTMLLYAAVSLCSALFIRDELTFAIAFISHCVLSGVYFTITASLPLRLFPQAKFAQYNSAAGIVQSLANIIVVPTMGKLLDISGHDYRYIFFAGSLLAFGMVLTALAYYPRFKAHGGPDAYTAPE